ncbi:transcription factor GTE4-like [Ananas comosus]|uniref:Transcription factor GTE4-like n=1 Tax=Ananas comosus TaxID=4615 RepID=A0A6P5FM91_ANACO|nr:transcription factor GTE4-like [Ananas comosus]
MASGPLVGAGGAGGDGSRERHRWAESKVYTRKSHNKASTKPSSAATSQPPPSSSQTPSAPPSPPSPAPPFAADEVNSSHHRAPPPPPPPPPPPAQQPQLPSSAASDDDASSLNRAPPPGGAGGGLPNGNGRSVTISLASRSRQEVRELRRKLAAELEQVRTMAKRLDARERQLAASAAAAASVAPAAEYTVSQLSATDPNTPVPSKSVAAPFRRQLSVSVAAESNLESLEKEKRTPKANQFYQNPDFVSGKDKFPPPDPHGHKKSKANGSKKHLLHGEADHVEKKLYTKAFKQCASLLSKLMKHKHGWVFNTPVDVRGLGLHDYYTIIRHPMDLGTVKNRLTKNMYKSPWEFAEDVRLTFRNAMTYNPKGQDVHIMAEHLYQMFEERWAKIEAELSSYRSRQPAPKKPPPLDMRSLERSDSTAHPMAVDSKSKPAAHTPHIGRPPALKKPKAKDPHKREMTFEEKQRLSNNLQNLPPEKLDNVVQIIKRKNLSLSQHDDEIEVDIDSFDVETLWELDRFVTNYKKSLSKNKRKAELAVQARQEAEQNSGKAVQERVTETIVPEAPKENIAAQDDKYAASSSPAQGDKEENAARSSSSSSSSSDSGSSSSDSDSDSSSAYGSDAGHSPRT